MTFSTPYRLPLEPTVPSLFHHHLIFLYGDDFFINRDLVINSEIQIPNFIEYQEEGSQPEKTAEPWVSHKPEEVFHRDPLIFIS